jgi:hypothetical protein
MRLVFCTALVVFACSSAALSQAVAQQQPSTAVPVEGNNRRNQSYWLFLPHLERTRIAGRPGGAEELLGSRMRLRQFDLEMAAAGAAFVVCVFPVNRSFSVMANSFRELNGGLRRARGSLLSYFAAGARLLKSTSDAAARYVKADHTATAWLSCFGSILSSVSSAV